MDKGKDFPFFKKKNKENIINNIIILLLDIKGWDPHKLYTS